MRAAISAILATALIAAGGLAAASSAPAAGISPVEPPVPPLRVKIESADGRPTIRLARRMTVLSTCSKTCRARVDLILRTPTNTLRLNRWGRRNAAVPWASVIGLNRYGLGYMSLVWRFSSLRVVVRAIDPETSRRTVRTRVFRFRRR